MKRVFIFLCTMMLAWSFTVTVQADQLDLVFDAGSWNHSRVYYYAIDWDIPDDYEITAASVKLRVRNWMWEKSMIFVGILDEEYDWSYPRTASDAQYNFEDSIPDDGNAHPDATEYDQLFEVTYWDPFWHTIEYDFDEDEMDNLEKWLKYDGLAGLGVDTDCHFRLDGGNFSITTEQGIPEPATMLLLGTGLVGLAGFSRKFRK